MTKSYQVKSQLHNEWFSDNIIKYFRNNLFLEFDVWRNLIRMNIDILNHIQYTFCIIKYSSCYIIGLKKIYR